MIRMEESGEVYHVLVQSHKDGHHGRQCLATVSSCCSSCWTRLLAGGELLKTAMAELCGMRIP